MSNFYLKRKNIFCRGAGVGEYYMPTIIHLQKYQDRVYNSVRTKK